MKKTLVALLLIVFAATGIYGAPVSPDKALTIANDLKRSQLGEGKAHRAPADYRKSAIAFTSQTTTTGEVCFYVVNYGDGAGFAIISGDDRLEEVLGYCDEGAFDSSNIPANVKWWLDSYTEEISRYYADPKLQARTVKVRRASKPSIEPLLTTKWNQGAPYNNLCGSDAGGRHVTGCVATALAQVMKFHNWPDQGVGSNAGVNFADTKYNWDAMLDTYTDGKFTGSQATAVATLMRHCGAAVNMRYSSSESGAYVNEAQTALTDYFKYNKGLKMLSRDCFSYSEWASIIYDELAARRPVFYSGQASTGGHAFVCDGFRSGGYYHFNWGWGGAYDGYFLLYALNPGGGGIGSHDGGYNSNQVILTGVEKDNGKETRKQVSLLATGSFTYAGGNTFAFSDSRENMAYNPHNYDISIAYGIGIESAIDPTDVTYVRSGTYTFAPYQGITQFAATIPNELPDGKYYIHPALCETSNPEWQYIYVPFSMQTYVTLVRKDGKNEFLNEQGSDRNYKLMLNDAETSRHISEDSPCGIRFFITNVGNIDYTGQMTVRIYDKEYPDLMQTFDYNVSIPVGMTSTVDFVEDIYFLEGEYVLDFLDADGNTMMEPYTLVLEPKVLDYEIGSVSVSKISPNFANTADGAQVSTFISNSYSGSAVTGVFHLNLFDYDMNPVLKTSSEEATLYPSYAFPFATENAKSLEGIGAGDYMWSVNINNGPQICGGWPLKLLEGPYTNNGLVWLKEYEDTKSARLSYDEDMQYAGEVVVPEKIEGYTIEAIRGGTFTFARDLKSLTLPASIKVINPAEFYFANNLAELRMSSSVPPAISSDAMREERFGEVTLYTPEGAANTYMRTPVWDRFFMPQWTEIKFESGISYAGGLDTDPATGKPWAPYFVNPSETPEISIAGANGQDVYLVYTIDDTPAHVLTFKDGKCRLPRLEGRKGSVVINTTGLAGVQPVVPDSEAIVDVYDLLGRQVLKQVSAKEIGDLLPAGIYVAGGKRIIVK